MRLLPLLLLWLYLPPTSLTAAPSDRATPALLVQVLEDMENGHYPEAESRLREAPSDDPHVLRLLIELASRSGDKERVESLSVRLRALYGSGQLRTADEVAQAAYATWQLRLWKEANQIFIEAEKMGSASASLYVDWGNLYLATYNAAEAESIFLDGTKAASPASGYTRWGTDSAYLGLARALSDQFRPGVEQSLEKALELNPDSLEATTFQAILSMEERDWEKADEWIRKGLKRNPRHLPLLEAACASLYFQDRNEAFEEAKQSVLEINPRDGDLFELLGDLSNLNRRLEESVEFYRESLRRNPNQESARASLGISLLRLGQEEEGTQVLELAYSNDPFNLWTVNTLRLLDSWDNFVHFDTARFRIKLHQEEAPVLRPYVEELAERSLRTLEQKYNHQVPDKIVFEMYPDHADFAVRTLGLPGLGALGATFGKVVAMDSPAARPKGEFHWGSTLWHEMAHVVTLSLSKGRVPRWFTEGLSMMEERLAGEGWGDYLSLGFVKAYQEDQLLPLTELNSGFERPKSPQQLTLSYFQAGWICDFLLARYGFERIPAMLIAFGEGKNTSQVFEEVLGQSVDDFDQQFQQELAATLQPLGKSLSLPEGHPQTLDPESPAPVAPPTGIDELAGRLRGSPESYVLNLQLGAALESEGQAEEAIPYLERALELFPTRAGQDSPYPALVRAYQQTGNTEKLLETRRRWWLRAPLFMENLLELGSLLSEPQQAAEAAGFLEDGMYLDPLRRETHERLGELYLELEQPGKAVREFEVLMNLDPVDTAATHYKLALARWRLGDAQGARKEVLKSLEIAPSYGEALQLLLQLSSK